MSASTLQPTTDWSRTSTAGVVLAAAAGDERAWRALVARYDRLVRIGVRRVRGLAPEDYEDAAASTWLHLVDDIHGLRNPAAVAPWLRTTAFRESLRIPRSRRHAGIVQMEVVPELLGWEPDPTAGIHRDEVRRAILGVIGDLSPTGRRLLLAFLDDPDASYKEIEARHGIGVSSIGPIRRRVLVSLERALEGAGVAGIRAAD